MIHCRKEFPAYLTYCGISVEKLRAEDAANSDAAAFLELPASGKCKNCAKWIRSRQAKGAQHHGTKQDHELAANLARFLSRGRAAQAAADAAIAKHKGGA